MAKKWPFQDLFFNFLFDIGVNETTKKINSRINSFNSFLFEIMQNIRLISMIDFFMKNVLVLTGNVQERKNKNKA